jgi:formylglycine-generating enzyme required for sulfatase activity
MPRVLKFPLSLGSLLILISLTRAFAQSSPGLAIAVSGSNASLTITADIGSPVTIQYATTVQPGATWFTLANSTLLSNPSSVVDPIGTISDTRFYRAVIAVPTNMVWVPAGTFVMGSPVSEAGRGPNNETQHTVTLTKGFFMGAYPVTQGNYLSVMNNNPSYYSTNHGFTLDPSRPVEQVKWTDATNYCGLFTLQERAAGRIFTNWVYRLPTESEWEYACRAGTATQFYYGTNLLSGMANFDGRYEYLGTGTVFNVTGVFLNRTVPVGGYQPNARGLYDLAGNVWEWCQDWYTNYPAGAVIDPQGPPAGTQRVFRGGSLNATGAACRSASRDKTDPSTAVNTIGFRVVLAAGP